MSNAQSFIEALHRLEESGDVEPIARLFANGADVSNPLVEHQREGEDGARAFWSTYRGSFDSIRSEFRNIVERHGVVMLEWISTGAVKGRDLRYGGVSVLEFGEGGITAFRSYFDPAKVGRAVTEAA